MKKLKTFTLYIPILLLALILTSCEEDNEKPQDVDVFLGCCSEDPVYGDNVDNLDQSINGEISVSDILTPNGDGMNDLFGITNIENYSNHSITIYNSEDELVFESNNYVSGFNSEGDFFPNGEQTQSGITTYTDGTYKYKLVIEDEQTFYKSGTFCLFTNNPPVEQQNFSECLDLGEFDQILTGY
ncbi:gliding motility-associated C-terminal domain-containing protein [Winogradskyella undariae]|uniref:T9SS type B sorting domain-containing protein n=1 Tax=Winogradskyella undariae TaxID=1285465 RepID=UPI00156AF544|nr:gliding motility-associated C-terminal domain-containing protein [Winogradskyella undariae]NRR90416.1 gliding motility-associated C-terminal domain-containing protein [Winogradskyella undariae]